MRRIVSRIARRLEEVNDRLLIVDAPDHPFLFRNPDILAAYGGHLAAVFVPDVTEIRNPDLLLARLIAARLALPMDAFCMVVDEGRGERSEILRGAFGQFDQVISADNIQAIAGYLAGDLRHHYPLVADFPYAHAENASHRTEHLPDVSQICYEISRQQLHKVASEGDIPPNVWIRHVRATRPATASRLSARGADGGRIASVTFRKLYRLEDPRFAVSCQQFKDTRNLTAVVRQHCARNVRYVFSMRDGMPYPRAIDDSPGRGPSEVYCTFLLADEVPLLYHDPLWPIRVLSMCRVSVVVASGPVDLYEAQRQFTRLLG